MSWWGGSAAKPAEDTKEEVWDLSSHDGIDEDQYALDRAPGVNDNPFSDSFTQDEDDTSMAFTHSVGNRVADVYEGLHAPLPPAGAAMPTDGRVSGAAAAAAAGHGSQAAAMAAAQQQQAASQAQFLPQSRKGLWETSMHNVGLTYLSGMALGSFYGVFEGAATAPKPRPRIVLNSVLNAMGKRASGVSNALGAITLLYTTSEYGLDYMDFDMAPDMFDMRRREIYTQMTAAACTAALYRLPQLVVRRNVTGVAIVGVSALLGAGVVAGMGAVGSAIDKDKRFWPVNWEA